MTVCGRFFVLYFNFVGNSLDRIIGIILLYLVSI